jgi:transposase InsO family protein
MKQMARTLTDAVDGFLLKHRSIVMARDSLFCHSFRDMLKNSGVKPVRLPSRSPNLNAYAERWIGSVRRVPRARHTARGTSLCARSSSSLLTIITKNAITKAVLS